MLFLMLLHTSFVFHQSNSLSAMFDQQVESIAQDQQQTQSFIQDLKEEIKGRIKTLKRPIKFYHYGTRGTINYKIGQSQKLSYGSDEAIDLARGGDLNSPVELSPPEARSYFKNLSDTFSTADKIKWNVGPGLYAAIDPAQSQSFAGSPWFLLEITAPAGTRYFDVRPFDGIVVSERFIEKWFPLNPENNSAHIVKLGKNRYLISFTNLLDIPSLRKLVVASLGELQTYAIGYGWDVSSIRVCQKRLQGLDTAFNFVSSKFLNEKPALKIYTQKIGTADAVKQKAYVNLLKKIESAVISFTSSPEIIAGQKQGYRAYTIDDWLSSQRMQTLTQTWADSLGRPSLLNRLIFNDPAVAEQALQYDDARNRCEEGKCPKNFAPKLSLENFKLTENRTDGNDFNHYFLDPLAYLKKTNPKEAERRLKLIESETFGCSPDPQFADERAPPEL